MSPYDGGPVRTGPRIVYENVKRIELLKLEDNGRPYARMKLQFDKHSSAEITIPIDAYDSTLSVEQDRIKCGRPTTAKLEG